MLRLSYDGGCESNMSTRTIDHLFDLAIAAENIAQAMYYVLADRFASYASVVAFWRDMARDEAIHARVLDKIRTRLHPDVLTQAVDPEIWQTAQGLLRAEIITTAQTATTLEAAYQLAHEIEHSEVNTIFEFLVTHFPENPAVREFLREQLQVHAQKLVTAFPEPYHQAEMRKAIYPTGT